MTTEKLKIKEISKEDASRNFELVDGFVHIKEQKDVHGNVTEFGRRLRDWDNYKKDFNNVMRAKIMKAEEQGKVLYANDLAKQEILVKQWLQEKANCYTDVNTIQVIRKALDTQVSIEDALAKYQVEAVASA